MSKVLIALIALDIGFILSKVYILNWKSNYLAIKKNLFQQKEIEIRHKLSYFFYFYFIKKIIKPIKELPTSSKTIKRANNFAKPIEINQNSL